MRLFRDSRSLSWLSGSRTDVPAEPPSHRPCVPLTSTADELKLQSLKIDGCSLSSVIKIVKMKYKRIDIKMWRVSTSFKINIEILYVRDPESQERERESLKSLIDVSFWFFHYCFFGIFSSNPQFWKKFQSVLGSQSSIVPPWKISLWGPGTKCYWQIITFCNGPAGSPSGNFSPEII
jgi:hypothetical protein